MSGHFDAINNITFPRNFGGVFASCSQDEIRLWSPSTQKELLKIELQPGTLHDFAKSNCVDFMADGKSIISGWTDGKIRAFLPQSGKLFWILNEAHKPGDRSYGGVTCLCSTSDCDNIISGGSDGEVRLWNIGKQTKKLQSAQKVHKGPITQVCLVDKSNECNCASSSLDGTIIVWHLKKFERLEKTKVITIPFSMKTVDESLENGVISMVYIPVSHSIACIDLDKKVSYVNLNDYCIEKQLQAAYDGQLTTICLSEMRHEIAVGDENGEIKVFSNLDGKLLHLD
jgi:WD40 repeat protein